MSNKEEPVAKKPRTEDGSDDVSSPVILLLENAEHPSLVNMNPCLKALLLELFRNYPTAGDDFYSRITGQAAATSNTDPSNTDPSNVYRCPSMKLEEKTMHNVLEEFKETYEYNTKMEPDFVNTWLVSFVRSFSREIDSCIEDSCQENMKGCWGDDYTFSRTHGASDIINQINGFIGGYYIRKCAKQTSYVDEKVSTLMLKLVEFLDSKGLADAEEIKDVKSYIQQWNAVDQDNIPTTLVELWRDKFWKMLPVEEDYKYDSDKEEYWEKDSPYSDTVDTEEYPLEVTEATSTGWVIETDDTPRKKVLLRLPPSVAKMGRADMIITYLHIAKRKDNGVYEPYNPHDYNSEPDYVHIEP